MQRRALSAHKLPKKSATTLSRKAVPWHCFAVVCCPLLHLPPLPPPPPDHHSNSNSNGNRAAPAPHQHQHQHQHQHHRHRRRHHTDGSWCLDGQMAPVYVSRLSQYFLDEVVHFLHVFFLNDACQKNAVNQKDANCWFRLSPAVLRALIKAVAENQQLRAQTKNLLGHDHETGFFSTVLRGAQMEVDFFVGSTNPSFTHRLP